jgi:cytochrome c biogenesis protein CcdA
MGFAVVVLGLWALKDVVLPGVGFPLAMPARWHGAVRQALLRTTPVALLTAGALVGLCTLPCSGAIYVGVLGLIAREPLPVRLSYLVVYNVMFVAPLLVLLVAVANRRVLNRIAHAYLQRKALVKAAVGAVTVALGLVILVTA